MSMILLINICKEKLHYFEFVKPVCDILDDCHIRYFVRNYKDVKKKDLEGCSKIIICGTSLYDNEFLKKENLKFFKWLLNFAKPVLGICGGMEVIGMVFKGKLKKKTEIGYYKEYFIKEFLGLIGKNKVYHLHNYFIDFKKLRDFSVFNKGKISQAIKHREKDIYGILFHAEVRGKDLIVDFCS